MGMGIENDDLEQALALALSAGTEPRNGGASPPPVAY